MNVAGIDVSTRAVDVVKLPLDSDRATWHRFEAEGRLAEDRLVALRSALPRRSTSFWNDVCMVAIERPAARHRTTVEQLMAVMGMVVHCIPVVLKPWFFMPAEWRKACGLPGNASKEHVAHWTLGNWTRLYSDPQIHFQQDALDAFCIAYACRAINERAAA